MRVTHTRHIPVMKQGKIQSCVGMALVGAIGSGDLYEAIPEDHPFRPTDDVHENELLAKDLYRRATLEDMFPAHMAAGGSSLNAVARVGKRLELIKGFRAMDTLEAAEAALEHRPIMFSGPWYAGFDTPDAEGIVEPSGHLVGGHAYVMDAVDCDLFGCTNSWGPEWALGGKFFIPRDVLQALFANGATAVSLVPVGKK